MSDGQTTDTTAADVERAQDAADVVERATAALVRGDAPSAASELAWHTSRFTFDGDELERRLVELACAGVAATTRMLTDRGAPTACECGHEDCAGWALALESPSPIDELVPTYITAAMRGLTAALNNEFDAARDVFEAVRASESTDVLVQTVTTTVRIAADAREQLGGEQ